MNYSAHYSRLISRAKGRILVGYRERHHVLPRCMGGGDEPGNIVELTGEEHYVAHQLLVKIHPAVCGLVTAAVLMAKSASGNKAFGWLRRRSAELMCGNKLALGHQPSLERRAQLSVALLGNRYGAMCRGKTISPETRAKTSAALRGRKHSPEARAKMSAVMLGKKRRPCSSETREKIAAAHLGKTHSLETRAKL